VQQVTEEELIGVGDGKGVTTRGAPARDKSASVTV